MVINLSIEVLALLLRMLTLILLIVFIILEKNYLKCVLVFFKGFDSYSLPQVIYTSFTVSLLILRHFNQIIIDSSSEITNSNLLSFSLKCDTKLSEWGYKWDSNSLVKVC